MSPRFTRSHDANSLTEHDPLPKGRHCKEQASESARNLWAAYTCRPYSLSNAYATRAHIRLPASSRDDRRGGPSPPGRRPQTPAPANPVRRRTRRSLTPDCLRLRNRRGTREAKRLAFCARPQQSASSRTPTQSIRILTQPTFSHSLRPFATFPDAGVGRPAPARQGGGMPIAITAAVARPWIIDPHDTIGNHCGMLSHQSLFKQLRLPLAQADRSLPP
jgi:hypothetical protein